jgi:penicillin-binding protein 2
MSPDSSRLRLGLAGLVVAGLFAAMFARLWYLQVLDSPKFQQAAVSNQVRVVYTQAPRGQILDRNGTPLVDNSVTEAITLSRDEGFKHPDVIDRLAALLGMTPTQIKLDLTDPRYSVYKPVPIKTNVPIQTVIYLREHQSEFPGVDIAQQTQRDYPNAPPGGPVAAQVLGYVGSINQTELAAHPNQGYRQGDQIGKAGVESSFEQWLRGTPGEQRLEVNAQGQVIKTLSDAPPRPGDNVQLTLDAGLQQEVQNDLANQIMSLRHTSDPKTGAAVPATGGAAVVLDPRDGSVLAMASYPTFDLRQFVGGISQADYSALTGPSSGEPMLNRAIQGLYTPGSTFKLATATAALDTGLISANSLIDDPTGVFVVPHCTGDPNGCSYHDAESGGLGNINVTTALAQSDDVFFYTLGYRFWIDQTHYGLTPIQNAASLYGLGELSGIDLPGEAKGRVDSPVERQKLHQLAPKVYSAAYYLGDNIEMAFGQAATVITPLQLANAYATFGNGGTRYQPQVAARILNRSGAPIKDFAPVASGHVTLPPQVHDPMLQGFKGAVTQGTASGTFAGFPLSKLEVAGKTGTASATNKEPTALFVAFAPADNPQYAVAVVIDQAGYGATGSAPVARQIFQYLIAHPIGPVQPPQPTG